MAPCLTVPLASHPLADNFWYSRSLSSADGPPRSSLPLLYFSFQETWFLFGNQSVSPLLDLFICPCSSRSLSLHPSPPPPTSFPSQSLLGLMSLSVFPFELPWSATVPSGTQFPCPLGGSRSRLYCWGRPRRLRGFHADQVVSRLQGSSPGL